MRSATIITTQAGPDMPIHDRQPVVLEPDAWEHWLDPGVTDRDELEPLLRSGVEGTLVHGPANRAVGNVRNNGPEMLEPEIV
jgi:putative SOS response-associated peptidase YedK